MNHTVRLPRRRNAASYSAQLVTLLAKSTIRPEDAQNPIRHLGLERGFPPSIAVQTAASEFANSVRCSPEPDIGDEIRTRIDEEIRVHEKLILVLSAHSIHSDWVEKEVETAFDKERKRKKPVLFAVRLDDAIHDSRSGWAADIRRTRHIGDFTRWKDHDAYRESFDRLLRALQVKRAGGDGPSAPGG